MDGFSVFLGAVYAVIFAAIIGLSYCVGADRVYQQCRDNGAYYVDSKKIMTCEATQ